jgi:hypothetical protein
MCSLAAVLALAVGANAGTKKGAGLSTTLTGCLQKGPEAGTFVLTNVTGGPAADNKEWELVGVPAALKLAEHVGHKVAVTGSVMGAGAAMKLEHKTTTTTSDQDSATVETTKTMTKEQMARHLKVQSMKHVAATCP